MVTTVGIDLAAAPRGTAVAVLDWRERGAAVVELAVGVDDDDLLAVLRRGAAKVGIDSPLGWPTAFVEFVTSHHRDELPADRGAEPGWRRPLVNRATDLHVRERVGLIPLSVSADLIGHTALRCAALLAPSESATTCWTLSSAHWSRTPSCWVSPTHRPPASHIERAGSTTRHARSRI